MTAVRPFFILWTVTRFSMEARSCAARGSVASSARHSIANVGLTAVFTRTTSGNGSGCNALLAQEGGGPGWRKLIGAGGKCQTGGDVRGGCPTSRAALCAARMSSSVLRSYQGQQSRVPCFRRCPEAIQVTLETARRRNYGCRWLFRNEEHVVRPTPSVRLTASIELRTVTKDVSIAVTPTVFSIFNEIEAIPS